MDPHDPSSFAHATLKLSTGRTYHFIDQPPANYDPSKTFSVVLIHGFPDFWYGWRYQIKAFVNHGYRVIVPDMLGVGGTDKLSDPADYTPKKLSNDLVALLDALFIPKAIFIGHDWGSVTAQRVALAHPDRIQALGILAVAYWPPLMYASLEELVKKEPGWGYTLYFASDQAIKDIDENMRRFFDTVYRAPRSGRPSIVKEGQMEAVITGKTPNGNARESLLNEQEFAYYLENFASMNGPLNYYRTSKYWFREEKDLPVSPSADLPVLYIGGSRDSTTLPSLVEGLTRFVPQLESEVFDEGHWLMIGKLRDEVTERIATWLHTVRGAQEA